MTPGHLIGHLGEQYSPGHLYIVIRWSPFFDKDTLDTSIFFLVLSLSKLLKLQSTVLTTLLMTDVMAVNYKLWGATY